MFPVQTNKTPNRLPDIDHPNIESPVACSSREET